jgi:copper chaperone NosL
MKASMFTVLVLVLLLSACGAAAVTPQTPPEILYGEDVCEHCGMIINDARFAAALVVETQPGHYEHRIFDDIGDMFAYAQALPADGSSGTIVTYYVHDYHSQEWIEADHAHFVQAEAALTPMASGLVAFASQEEAETQAQAWQGAVLTFDAVRQQTVMKHEHAHH